MSKLRRTTARKVVAVIFSGCISMALVLHSSLAQKEDVGPQKKKATQRPGQQVEAPTAVLTDAVNNKRVDKGAGVAEVGKPLFTQGGKESLERAKLISLEILSQQVQTRSVGAINDLKTEKVEIDDSQMAHTRVRQTVEGIPVWQGEAIVHLKSDGSLFAITDDLKEGVSVDTKPSISADEAVRIANNLYTGTAVETEAAKVDLWVYRGEDRDHLTYRVEIPRLDGSEGTSIPVDFIDAQTGQRVFGYDNLQTGTGSSLYSGTVTINTSSSGQNFFMEDLTRRMGTYNMNGTGDNETQTGGTQSPYVDSDDNWNASIQRAGVDAHYGAAKTFDYYLNVHGRNGIDGSGGPRTTAASANAAIGLITSRVHFGSAYKNAFWNGSVMTYGDGDGFQTAPLTTLDICGHEMTHGVTERTAGLIYAGESGALNESMSDVFGTMVERFARPSTWNWKIGEDAYTPGTSGDALRYMDNPGLDGHSPDHYSQRLYAGFCTPDKFNDRCGVHSNSSIANHAFYLIAAGGTNRVSGITVTGIGPDDAARIWYRALTFYMTSGTDFMGARKATEDAATAIFGGSSAQFNAVARGWCAVGVGPCPGSSGTCAPTAISAGQTINGSLSTSDCIFSGTTRYVDVYSFNGTAGQTVVVSMNSSSFDTYLYLVNSSNQVLSEDDDGGGGTNARIPSTSGSFTLPATGTYSIWATAFSANLVGPYSLTLTVSGGSGCPATPISIGQTVSGSLTTSDCFYIGTSRYVDLYTFSGNAGQQIAIAMNSSATDTYLYLVNTSNQILSQDDDSGDGLNSRIPGATGYFSLPATGTYTIHATTYEYASPNTGAYSLSLIPANSNPIDDSTFFVRQHYNDFLGRQPDAPGLQFWVSEIEQCGGGMQCREVKRINVSNAFFLSIEFQETGFYAIRVQRAAFNRRSDTSTSRMTFSELTASQQQIGAGVIVGQPGYQQVLDSNKNAYAAQVIASSQFAARFPQATAGTFVDALYASAGLTPTTAERAAAINAYNNPGSIGAANSRAAALRVVADSQTVRSAELRTAYVLMEYVGYLRRNPDDSGYGFWLGKLNSFNGDAVAAEMVKAFISSDEYRKRFGQ